MAKTKDVLQQKQKELADCQKQFGAAISIVTSTVQNLTHINEEIQTKVQEIEEYQSQLNATKTGLKDTQKKNERTIKNFNALLDVGDE